MFKSIATITHGVLQQKSLTHHSVTGWVKSMRKLKKNTFIDLHDGQKILKIVVPRDETLLEIPTLSIGSCVKLQGFDVVPLEHGFELKTTPQTQWVHLGPIAEDYPLQKKQTSMKFLRQFPQYKYKTNYLSALMKFRSVVEHELCTSLHNSEFISVHPPVLTGSDCEGGGEMFSIGKPDKYFKNDDPAYLTVSTQLHLEVMAQSLGKVYTVTPCFRAEKSDTSRHLSEFWMLELEYCFVEDIKELCGFTESLLKGVIKKLIETGDNKHNKNNNSNSSSSSINSTLLPNYKPIESTENSGKPLLNNTAEIYAKWQNLIDSKWEILEYSRVIDILKGQIELNPTLFKYNKIQYGMELQSEHEKWLAQEYCHNSPVFVINYPLETKPFYMKQNIGSGHKTVANFDLLVPGMGEIAGGSLREHDYDTLLNEIRAREMNVETLQWYLDLRRNGTAPHGGFGLGLERFVSYLFGNANIKDAIPFYRSAGSSLKP